MLAMGDDYPSPESIGYKSLLERLESERISDSESKIDSRDRDLIIRALDDALDYLDLRSQLDRAVDASAAADPGRDKGAFADAFGITLKPTRMGRHRSMTHGGSSSATESSSRTASS
jgi:hypothetical protein